MSTLTRSVPKAASRLTKALQADKMDVSRSPKASPPTIKKKLCRLVNGALNGDAEFLNALNASKTQRKESTPIPISNSNSILKKSVSRGSPDSTASSGSPGSRRVQFSQKVTVFLMSDEGDIFCSGCEKLNPGVENQRPSPRSSKFPSSNGLYSSGSSTSSRTQEICDLKSSSDDVVYSSEVDFKFIEDPDKGTVLKFVLPLGHDYKPDDIVVKANVSGSRIRLVANKPVSYPDGSMRMEQVNQRFMLPMDVDPYMVTARLDVRGHLTVEAPVLTLAKRDNMKRTNVALSDISNKAQSKA